MSKSLELARRFLGREVNVVIDRSLGSRHPRYPEIVRAVYYIFVPDTTAPDGEPLDAYYFGVEEPVERASGTCVAVIHRYDDDRLVVVADGVELPDS